MDLIKALVHVGSCWVVVAEPLVGRGVLLGALVEVSSTIARRMEDVMFLHTLMNCR